MDDKVRFVDYIPLFLFGAVLSGVATGAAVVIAIFTGACHK